ncbi:putative carboxylase:pyruvate acetyl-CoA/propionyl-CoA, partial [Neofusicoccum parvum]
TAGVAGGGGGGAADAGVVGGAAGALFRRGDAWAVALEERGGGEKAPARTHHLELERVLRNDFPAELAAEVVWASGAAEEGVAPRRTPFVLRVKATAASSGAALSARRRGDPGDPTHVCIPFAGKVVEVLVEEGDEVREGDVLCVVQQMKMELEVRSARAGRVVWAFEGEEGEEVAEGTLACVLELEGVGTEKARL